jgi:uncharacterized membrane protein YjjP (DUF1212 family)
MAAPGTDQAIDTALTVFENGGSTGAAERALRRVLAAAGHSGVAATWRLDCLILSGRGEDGPLLQARPIAPVALNLARAAEASALAERLGRGEVDAAGFAAELERIRSLPPPYGFSTLVAAAAVAAAAFALLLDGDNFWLPALASGLGQLVRSLWQRFRLARGSSTILCATFSGLIGATGLQLGLSATPAPTLVASVIYLVPGILLINGFLDLTREKYLFVGLQRLILGGFLFVLITFGVAVAAVAVRAVTG